MKTPSPRPRNLIRPLRKSDASLGYLIGMIRRPIALAMLTIFTFAVLAAAPATPTFDLPTDPAPAANIPSAGDQPSSVSLAEAFFLQRHPVTGKVEWLGSCIIWLLMLLSAASLGYLGAMTADARTDRLMPQYLRDRAADLILKHRADSVTSQLKDEQVYFARVLVASLAERRHGYDAMMRAGEQAAEEHAVRLLRRLEPLHIVGTIAPMIGLFGTVYGMILAFREIVAAGGTPDPVGLASGIGTALTTTFWGLIVAIPALAGFAFVRNALDERTVRVARAVEELVNTFRPPAKQNSVNNSDARDPSTPPNGITL